MSLADELLADMEGSGDDEDFDDNEREKSPILETDHGEIF